MGSEESAKRGQGSNISEIIMGSNLTSRLTLTAKNRRRSASINPQSSETACREMDCNNYYRAADGEEGKLEGR